MRKISLLIVATFSAIGGIQAQEAELNQLLSMQNKSAMTEFEGLENNNTEEALSFLLQHERNAKTNPNSAQFAQRYETHNVQVVINGGFTFHIADYVDGSRIITCLDGSEKGLQGIGFRGVVQAESRNVQWNKGHFVHFYPGGKVTSYPNKQISEVY